MYIRGFNSQGDLRRYLCVQEQSLTTTKFFQTLLKLQEDDPNYFYCRSIKIGNVKYAFIVGEHPDKRTGYRTCYTGRQIRERCAELLEDPFLSAAIADNPICINDEGHCVAWNTETNIMATAVVDEQTGLIYLFEAGFQFVRLVTIWNIRDHAFLLKQGTKAVKLCANGFLESNMENIPEVFVETRPPKSKCRQRTHGI